MFNAGSFPGPPPGATRSAISSGDLKAMQDLSDTENTLAADRAFLDIKHNFIRAPILVHLDPSYQFIVEADASDARVGAVLCQCSALDVN